MAARRRAATPRRRAAARACRPKAAGDAEDRRSRLNAVRMAVERVGDGFRRARPLRNARAADCRVFAVARPFGGGGSLTPARRAFDRPMAIACLVDLAPCFPFRT